MKVKIIDILNRLAEGKNIPKKIKIYDEVYIYDKERNDYKVKHGCYYFFDDIELSNSNCLNDEVEILDNETNEIEEITYITSDENTMICIQKINELVRAVNKIQKEQVLTKSLNIISDCAKETNCMSD